MRVGVAIFVCAALFAPTIAAADDSLPPRTLLLKGRYDEAVAEFAKSAGEDPAAAIGLARCRLATGRRDDAAAGLTAAAEKLPKSAAIHGELALLALRRGDHDAAAREAAAAVALDKDCVSAHWVQAELLRLSGKISEAQSAYAWFIGYHNRAPQIADPMDLLLIGRAVAEHARWTRNSNQFRRLVNDVYPSALRRASDFWPAHFEAALLYLEKYNEAEATAEIDRGLAINPHAAELHAAKAALALSRFNLAAAKSSLDRALEINPELIWAHQLRADSLLADLRPAEAIPILEKALQLNPRDEATLGRLLAAHTIAGPPHKVEQIAIGATRNNPHCGEVYLAAAESFDRMRRFTRAAEYYRLANDKLPQLISARGELGLTLMRLGEEAEAAKLLNESFAIDPFNVRVKNMLEVLDVLKDYATIETEHFVIRFDRGQDELLARYASRHLEEEVFPQLTRLLGYTPEGKTLIEIFNRSGRTSGHSWFSARMVGLPFIHTVGACAGKMVALTSPGELPEKYDWATVLRHEFVHVLNLQQTDFGVPHWLTEGLAVHLEAQPRPKKWTQLLASRARSGELFDLDTLTLGFIRPQSSDDWTLAYCQAELYIEFLLATYGEDAIAKLLAAYRDRLTTADALARCYGVKQADLEAKYKEYVSKQIEGAGKLIPREKPKFADLERKVEAGPPDADLAAEFALACLDRGLAADARKWALEAQKQKPRHGGAAYVLARQQMSIGDFDAAVKLLENGLDKSALHEEALALLAAVKLKDGDFKTAEELYQLGDQQFPGSDRWVTGLARVYLQPGGLPDAEAKLLPVLRRWSQAEPDNLTIRQKLAEVSLAQKDYGAAAGAALEIIHRDVEYAAGHALLAAALAAQEKNAAAVDEYQTALRLDGKQPAWQAALARLLIGLGKKEEAGAAIERLRELDPKHPQIAELEKSLTQ